MTEKSPLHPKESKFTEGAFEAGYRQIIHTSPTKIDAIHGVVEKDEEKLDRIIRIEDLNPKQKAQLEEILKAPEDPEVLPCYCGRCICGKHNCPSRTVRMNFPTNLVTNYKQDYVKHPLGSPDELVNANKIQRTGVPKGFDNNSTYRKDFIKHPIEEEPIKTGEQPYQGSMPFASSTTYRMEYPNWGAHKLPPLGRCKETTFSLPFHGASTYAADFAPYDKSSKSEPFKRPEGPKKDVPFSGLTTSKVDYKPYHAVPPHKYKQEDELSPAFNFPGQFDTTNRLEHNRKHPKECPCETLNPPPNLQNSSVYVSPAKTH